MEGNSYGLIAGCTGNFPVTAVCYYTNVWFQGVHTGGLLHGAGGHAGVHVHTDTWTYLGNLPDWRVPWVRQCIQPVFIFSVSNQHSTQLWRSGLLCTAKFMEFKKIISNRQKYLFVACGMTVSPVNMTIYAE